MTEPHLVISPSHNIGFLTSYFAQAA